VKVAIVGMARVGDGLIPFGQPDWHVWGLNELYRIYNGDGANDHAPFTGWWELHGDTPLTRSRRPPNHFDVVKSMNVPVYYLHGDPPTPTAERLDIDTLAKQGRDYFACTFAYQIAKAMELGATEIAMFGTPLSTNREVVVERPCVTYWLGRAEERGITVSVHHIDPTGLLRHPARYALDDEREREAAYDASYRAFWTLAQWIPQEAQRLGLDQ
jgi:hypothetical protein